MLYTLGQWWDEEYLNALRTGPVTGMRLTQGGEKLTAATEARKGAVSFSANASCIVICVQRTYDKNQ